MKHTGEEYLDLNGPYLRGSFSTADLVRKLNADHTDVKEYVAEMLAKNKMFWHSVNKSHYYAFMDLSKDAGTENPMRSMPYRYGGPRYSIGSLVVYDAPPYPVIDTANQEGYVFKSRRHAFDMAVRVASTTTPYGADIPLDAYYETERELALYDDKGMPVAYGRQVFVSSADALRLLTGEQPSRSLRSRIRELFPHASYLASGAPLITAHVSGAIGVYLNFESVMDRYSSGDAAVILQNGGIQICQSDAGRCLEEIVSGWQYADLRRLLTEKGTGLHPSAYDKLLLSV